MAELDFNADEMEDMDPVPQSRIRSTVTAVKKQKGRGFRGQDTDIDDRGGTYDSLDTDGGAGPLRSVEGWVIFVTNVHEEAQEEDLHEAFSEFGEVKNISLNLDRRTGYVKGYALIEYASKNEAEAAMQGMDGQELLTQIVNVTWAFSKAPIRKAARGARARR